MQKRAPILFMDETGSTHPRPSVTAFIPVVEIIVPSNGGDLREFALIDTGAQHNYIDVGLAAELGLPALDGKVRVSPIGNAQWANIHPLKVRLCGAVKDVSTGFIGVGIANTGRKYRFIFGFSGIKHFRLTLDFHGHEYFLDPRTT